MSKTVTIKISGMHCKGCALGVQAALEKLPQVISAKATYPEQVAVVELSTDTPDEGALRDAVKGAGFEVEHIQ